MSRAGVESASAVRPMTIAFIVLKHLLRGGGIEKYTYELGRRLVARGHRVIVYTMKHYGRVEPDVEGMRVVQVPSIRGATTEKMSAVFASSLAAVLGRERPDIVHCHSTGPGMLGPVQRLRGARTVLQMHGLEWKRSRWGPFGRRVLKWIELAAMRGHAAYTAVSREQCDLLLAEYGVEFEYIPTGTEIRPGTPPRLIHEMGLSADSYVLFASRLVREKGAHYLIDAFRMLDTTCRLVIAGDALGEKAYLDELRRAAAGDARICFTGYVEGELLEELFSNAAAFVQPSDTEGLSIALLEAMGHARCCLVSDIRENLEAIGDAGFSFKQGSVAALSAKLRELLAASDLRRAAGLRAQCRVRDEYSWERVTDSFESLYARVGA
jgi:glycosyltransferase involved in cell wall biosynthesis